MTNKTIKYYVKHSYGHAHKYVADQKIAASIRRLTGTKTLLNSDIEALTELGFTFEQVIPPDNE